MKVRVNFWDETDFQHKTDLFEDANWATWDREIAVEIAGQEVKAVLDKVHLSSPGGEPLLVVDYLVREDQLRDELLGEPATDVWNILLDLGGNEIATALTSDRGKFGVGDKRWFSLKNDDDPTGWTRRQFVCVDFDLDDQDRVQLKWKAIFYDKS